MVPKNYILFGEIMLLYVCTTRISWSIIILVDGKCDNALHQVEYT